MIPQRPPVVKESPASGVRGSLILCGRGRRAPGGNLDVFDLPAVPQWPYQRAGDGDMNEPPVFVNDEFVSGCGEEKREGGGEIGERRTVIRANVGGAAYQVAGLLRASNGGGCVVFGASSPGRDEYSAA